MKCLIRNSDNVVIYAQDNLLISESCLSSDDWVDYNFNSLNSTLLDLETPTDLIGGAYQYVDGGFVIHNQSIIDSHLSPQVSKVYSISMRQARLQLLTLNLLDSVNAAMVTMPQSASIEWEFSTEVKRDNILVLQVQSALGMSDTDMDLFFVNANNL